MARRPKITIDDLRPGLRIDLDRVNQSLGDTRPVTSIVARVENGRIFGYDPHWGKPETARDVTNRFLGISDYQG